MARERAAALKEMAEKAAVEKKLASERAAADRRAAAQRVAAEKTVAAALRAEAAEAAAAARVEAAEAAAAAARSGCPWSHVLGVEESMRVMLFLDLASLLSLKQTDRRSVIRVNGLTIDTYIKSRYRYRYRYVGIEIGR